MKQDNEKSGTGAIRKEVEGQFARSKHGRKNDGVANAAPKTITGSEDATFDTDPKDKPLGTAKKKRRQCRPSGRSMAADGNASNTFLNAVKSMHQIREVGGFVITQLMTMPNAFSMKVSAAAGDQ